MEIEPLRLSKACYPVLRAVAGQNIYASFLKWAESSGRPFYSFAYDWRRDPSRIEPHGGLLGAYCRCRIPVVTVHADTRVTGHSSALVVGHYPSELVGVQRFVAIEELLKAEVTQIRRFMDTAAS